MIFEFLAKLRDDLAMVPGVNTCKIGIETGIDAGDFPAIRIVPSAIANGQNRRSVVISLSIYIGLPIDESVAGLESLYQNLLSLEESVRVVAEKGRDAAIHWNSTVLDEDRIPLFKLLVIQLDAILSKGGI